MSSERPSSTVFYFDTTHGKLIYKLLKSVGLDVRTYKSMGWCGDKLDTEWIAECGKNNWAIISGDKAISRIPEERQAVIDAKCKVFMFDDGHTTRTEDWAASLLVGRDEILRITTGTNGPLFVTVKPCRVRGHISKPDFVASAGAGWKIVEQEHTVPEINNQSPPKQRRRRSPQEVFEFPISVSIQGRISIKPHCELCARMLSGDVPTTR